MTTSTPTLTAPDYEALALACLAPDQGDDFWDWCCARLVMPSLNRFDPRRAGLTRHWYRLVQARLAGRPDPRDPYAHLCEQVYLCFAAQIAKTTLLHATLLYCLANQPRKMALFRNRLQDLKADRLTKLQRQLERMPSVAKLLPRGQEARERALGAQLWTVGTSLLFYKSGAVADDWRADDLELMALDEFDVYPLDVEGYGDPIDQGLARQRTYRKTRLLLAGSTPGDIAGHCWRRTCSGTHERPLVDCPHCQGAQDLDPRRVVLDGGRKLAEVSAAEITAAKLGRFACRHCGTLWTSADLHRALRAAIALDRPWCPGIWAITPEHPQGYWTIQADLDEHGRLRRIPPAQSTIRSGWACSLYSIDETVDSFAAKAAIAQQGTPVNQKTFANNECASPALLTFTQTDTDDISARAQPAETYRLGSLPRAARWLILHFDQQGNTPEFYWFPWVLRAVAEGGESWLVDAGKARNAQERDQLERETWTIGGTPRRADRVTMDSANGNFLFDAYLWAASDRSRRALLRGDPRLADGIPWQEVVDHPNARRKTPKPAGVREWRISPHFWRTLLWDRMRGVGRHARWWLPQGAPQFYLASLTSEEQVIERRRVTGQGWRDIVVWRPRVVASTQDHQTFRSDNHWWDAEVSIAAATSIFGWDRAPRVDTPAVPAPSQQEPYA